MSGSTAEVSLDRLVEGNARFLERLGREAPLPDHPGRAALVGEQTPFAVVLGCADSRVPPEVVFDAGLGDLFVVRVAGTIATPTQLGSIEYAVDALGCRQILVLGHTRCGAVAATLAHLAAPSDDLSPNLAAIVGEIAPAVGETGGTGAGVVEPEERLSRAVRANTRAAAARLPAASGVIARAIAEDGLRVVAAEYSLETGAVTILDPTA